MIITEKFVMLDYPKTGSSFTREILKRLHHPYDTVLSRMLKRVGLMNKPGMVELMVSEGRWIHRSQHGNYRQIPEQHRNKTIVTIVRNPLERYVSEYLYGWWKEHPQGFRREIEEKFQEFPELSFERYFEMISLSAANETKRRIGYGTIRFVKFYFRDPEQALLALDDEYIEAGRYKDDMPEIVFLHQESLNDELHAFLLRMGYPENDIAFIKGAERINVTRREAGQLAMNEFFTPATKAEVYERDKLLFTMFPEYMIAD